MQGKHFTAWMLAAVVAALLALAGSVSAAALQAQFTWSPQSPQPGQQVTFTSTSSGNPQTYAWDLDNDGQYDDGNTPTIQKTFNDAGNYKIGLQVADNHGNLAQAQHMIHVNTNLQSSFTWSPESPTAGAQVTFTSTSTSGGSITSYDWDLNGDRKYDDATGPTATYTFADAGDHQVGLRVTDNTGARAESFSTVSVAPPPPPPPADTPPSTAPSGPAWLNPFPSVRIRGRATAGGVHLSLFAARAPVGTTLKMRCKGTRCPKRRGGPYTLKTDRLRLRGLERFLTAGTKIELFIWKKGLVGKYTRFEMRRAKPPIRVDRCLYPGGKWPGRCPS